MGQMPGILAGHLPGQLGKVLGRHIVDIVIIHGVEGIYQRHLELVSDMDAGNTHGEFCMDVDDVRMELLQQLGTGVAVRGSQAVAIDFLEFDSGTVQHAVLDVMVMGIGVGSDYQNGMSQLFQTLPQELDVGYHAIDIWQIGFGKQCNTHSSSPL